MTQLTAPGASQREVARVEARGAIYRLAAVALAYPLEETWLALADGRLQQAFDSAWQNLGGESWPLLDVSPSLTELEVGYMATFVHGKRGKPRVPLVASAHDQLVCGQTAGTYMLNVQAFYTHFGLTAAVEDEGHKDQPDHLLAMLEFCALVCHFEAQALANGRDPAPYRRAQRDFLARYLIPLLRAIRAGCEKEQGQGLDSNLSHLVEVLPGWAQEQQRALEAHVGACPQEGDKKAAPDSANQPMWN